MKDFLKNKFTTIIVVAILVIFTAFTAIFTASAGMPTSSVQTLSHNETGYYYTFCYKVNLEDNQEVHSVWLNIGNTDTYVKNDVIPMYVEINVGRSSSDTKDFAYRTDGTQDSEKASFKIKNDFDTVKPGSWHLIYNYDTPTTDSYFMIATKNQIKVNEIVFLGVEKDNAEGGYINDLFFLDATSIGSGFNGKESAGNDAWYKALDFKTTIIDRTEKGINDANLLIDEQSTFKTSNVKEATVNGKNSFVYKNNTSISKKEYSVSESVKDIYSNKAGLIDKGENPIGLMLIRIGTGIFGRGSFALRLVPMILSLGAIYISYLIAKRFIKKEKLALVVPFIVAVGLLFVLITSAFTYASAIFFLALTGFFCIRYLFKYKATTNVSFVNAIAVGLSFAFALGCKTYAIFFAPIIMGAIGYFIFLHYKRNLKVFKDKERKQILAYTYREIVGAVVSIMFVPVIVLAFSFFIVAPALASFYQFTDGLFLLASKHFFGAF